MRVFKRGNFYWYDFQFNGKLIRKSAKTRNKDIARQVASVAHAAYVKGEVGLVEKKAIPRFGDAMDSFLRWSQVEHAEHPGTTVRYRTSSKPLLKHFKAATMLDRISAADVEDYKALRSRQVSPTTKRRLRPATVNRELACLKAMYNHVLKGDLLLKNPVGGVSFLDEDNLQDRILTYAEQDRYLEAASPLLRDVAGLMLETGMRPGEVYELRGAAVDLEANALRVLRGKTPAAKRRLELTEEARRILEARVAKWGRGYLFPFEGDPTRHIPKVDTQHAIALKNSGVHKFRIYDLRHTWATRAAEGGTDSVTLASMLGHSKIHMVMRYVHPTQEHQKSAMIKVQEHVAAARAREKARLAEQQTNSKVVTMARPA